MARGYRRLSPADEDEIWARLRAGHAAKPTARALGWSTSGVRRTELRLCAQAATRLSAGVGRLVTSVSAYGLAASARCHQGAMWMWVGTVQVLRASGYGSSEKLDVQPFRPIPWWGRSGVSTSYL